MSLPADNPSDPATNSARIDYKFAPCVALLSGVLGSVVTLVVHRGWHLAWPLIGFFGVVGGALLISSLRRRQENLVLAVLGTSFTAVSVVAALIGLDAFSRN